MTDMYTARINAALAVLLLSAGMCLAQPKTRFMGELQGECHKEKGFSYQGMDVWGKTIVSLQNQGIATIYKLSAKGIQKKGQFHLGSYSKINHANVASFGPWKASEKDRLPLLYVSHCNKKPIGSYKDPCYVERIHSDFKGSDLVQTIVYDDTAKDFGYALQWVIDRDRKLLIGYGNTVNNSDPSNRHRVIVFPLPKPSQGPRVILSREDALENYTIEEASGFSFNPIGQGLYVKKGKLYMPTGLGTTEKPSILYIWDLDRKQMKEVDLSSVTTGELEDISLSCKGFVLQGQDGIWIFKE